jgi:hypothetical protein
MNLATLIVRKSMGVAQAMIPAYVEGSMNSLVRITRPGHWSGDTGEYDPDAGTVVYADDVDPELGAMAGIALGSGPLTLSVGDEPEYYDTLTVYIPRHATEPWIDDILVVMARRRPTSSRRSPPRPRHCSRRRLVPRRPASGPWLPAPGTPWRCGW